MNLQTKKQIIHRINQLPDKKLWELERYVTKIEQTTIKNRPRQVLSYAGSWHDLDGNVFTQFTDNLIKNRNKNRPRINE